MAGMKRTLVSLSIGTHYGVAPVPRAVFWWPPGSLWLFGTYDMLEWTVIKPGVADVDPEFAVVSYEAWASLGR